MMRTITTTLETAPSDEPQDVTRLADLFSQFMSKTLRQRLLVELPEAVQHDLTLAQAMALRYLWLHEKVFIGELADGLETSYPSATNMVTRLEEKGLVRRLADPNDRRAVQAALTESGRTLAEQLENERKERFDRILERMSEGEREALLCGLRRFVLLAADSDACTANDICLRCGWRASADCPLSEIIPLFACR